MDTNFSTQTGRLVKESDIFETNNKGKAGKVLFFTIAVQRMGVKNPTTNKYSYSNADFIPCVVYDGSAAMFYAQQVKGFIKKGTHLSVRGSLSSFVNTLEPDNPKSPKVTELKLKVVEFHVIMSQKNLADAIGEKSCEDNGDYPNDNSEMGFDL